MDDFQITGIKKAITSLLPSSEVYEDRCDIAKFKLPVEKISKQAKRTTGFYVRDGRLHFYFPIQNHNQILTLTVKRSSIPFTKGECKLFRPFSKLITPLLVGEFDHAGRAVQRIATFHAFQHIIVAAAVRGSRPSITTFAVTSHLLDSLQALAVERYEGHKCTSGFIFANKPARLLSGLDADRYMFEPLESKINVFPNHTFPHLTWSPAAFRYVDGKNSFYLVNRQGVILGILRCRSPNSYSLLDRSSNRHINPLLSTGGVRVWVGYVGDNDDVNIAFSNHKQLRWLQRHWHFIDKKILSEILVAHGLSSVTAEDISSLIFAVSDLRSGTVLLIPSFDEKLPPVAGSIDQSQIAESLHKMLEGKNINQLIELHSAIGMLTSDGLTIVSRSGCVLACGQIIDLNSISASISGGGRTQAAVAASYYGLSIKVSEDGPVSLFKDGKRLIHFNY